MWLNYMMKNIECLKQNTAGQREIIAHILKILAEIKFGSIEITIHDGKVTQIERKEKIRPTQAH